MQNLTSLRATQGSGHRACFVEPTAVNPVTSAAPNPHRAAGLRQAQWGHSREAVLSELGWWPWARFCVRKHSALPSTPGLSTPPPAWVRAGRVAIRDERSPRIFSTCLCPPRTNAASQLPRKPRGRPTLCKSPHEDLPWRTVLRCPGKGPGGGSLRPGRGSLTVTSPHPLREPPMGTALWVGTQSKDHWVALVRTYPPN